MRFDDPRRGRHRPYFAYGSNMLRERLRAADRAPSATDVGVARLDHHRLDFHKRSWRDGSGKCTISALEEGSSTLESVYGVLFRLDAADHAPLDRVEGVGSGYRLTLIEVEVGIESRARQRVEAWTYVAMDEYLEPGLRPFRWYRDLVLAGARQHGLPAAVLTALARQPVLEDPDVERSAVARHILRAAESALTDPRPASGG